MQQGGQWYSPLADALGSLRQWTDAAGAVVGSASYDPFGGVLSQQGLTSPWGFAGEYHDPTTGLQYLRARWYQPGVGRFTQRDPFPGVLALPLTLNPYVYGLNNPTRYTDPTGEVIPITLAGILLGAGTAFIADFAIQVFRNHYEHCLPWGEAVFYPNLDWGSLGGAAIAGGVAGGLFAAVSGAVPALLKILGGSGWALRFGTIVVNAYLGAGTNLVGDFTGRVYQSYYLDSQRKDILDSNSYISDIFWGALLATLSSSYAEFTKVRISSANAAARSQYIMEYRLNKGDEIAKWGEILVKDTYLNANNANLVWNRLSRANSGPSSAAIKTVQSPLVPLLTASTQAVDLLMNSNIANAVYKIMIDNY